MSGDYAPMRTTNITITINSARRAIIHHVYALRCRRLMRAARDDERDSNIDVIGCPLFVIVTRENIAIARVLAAAIRLMPRAVA